MTTKKKREETVEQFARAASDENLGLPHMAEMYEMIIENFGGAEKFAKILVEQFHSSKEMQRTKILTSILAGIQILTEKGQTRGGEDDDPASMSEDELKRSILNMIDETANTE